MPCPPSDISRLPYDEMLPQCWSPTPFPFYAIRTYLSFFKFAATSIEILSVLATISGGVSASHCVNGISATRSAL